MVMIVVIVVVQEVSIMKKKILASHKNINSCNHRNASNSNYNYCDAVGIYNRNGIE